MVNKLFDIVESEPSKSVMIKGLPTHTTEPMVDLLSKILSLSTIICSKCFNYIFFSS